MSPILRDMMMVSLKQAIPIVEKMIESAVERDVRDGLVRRLAALDQRLSALRDMPNIPWCEGRR